MKSLLDPRHKHREMIIKNLYQWGFQKSNTKDKSTRKIIEKLDKIDSLIVQAAPEWPVQQINRVDLAILRLAIFELKIEGKQPPKVIIDEAIELAKTYGGEKSPSFVNGVLGTVLNEKP